MRVWLFAVLVLSFTACPPQADQLLIRLPDGTSSSTARFDFGPRGATTVRTFVLVNATQNEIGIDDLSLEGAFSMSLPAGFLAKGGEVPLHITYEPQGADAVVLTIPGGGRTLASLQLLGQFEVSLCELPDVVDFGAVLVGENVVRTVAFPVQTARRDVFVGAPGTPFTFPLSNAPSGTQSVGAGEQFTARVQLPARLTPGELTTTWRLDAGGGCPPRDVTLRATVLEHFLSASPTSVDFGTASAPAQPSSNATLLNALTRPVTVTLELQASAGGPTSQFSSGLTQLVLPAATRDAPGAGDVPLTAWLLGAGTVQGKLVATTAGANGVDEVFEVPLVARGAGAGLAVHPSPVELLVPRIDMTVLPVATGVRVVNEARGASAASVTVNQVTIEADTGSVLDAICVGAWAANVCMPIAAFTVMPGAQMQLPIRLSAAGRWFVVLHTDDALQPELRVEVKGHLSVQSECVLQQPQSLRFGPVRAPTPLVQTLVLENQSLASCLVQGLWIDGSADVHAESTFSIGPGERKFVDVEYLPTTAPGTSTLPTLRYSVNSRTAPVRSIPLEALSDDGCLFISPEQFDFGTVGPSCAAREQSFGLGNRCANTEVDVVGARITGLGPFTLDGTGQRRLLANSFTPDVVRVRFDPTIEGRFTGALEFDVTIASGGTRAFIVPLRGTSTNLARQRDRFVVPNSADALLIQDTTSTMDPLWQGLGAQAQAFVDGASQRARAVRIGAIEADATSAVLREVGGASWLDLELQPVQPLTSLLTAATSTTAAESFRTPALLALTGANITGANRGFLRRGASLNVMVATDGRDQSTAPVSVALPQLAAIKGSHRPELFSWSLVGPLAATAPTGCTYDDAVISPTDELAPVTFTAGVSLEVCSAKTNPAVITSQVMPTLFGDRDSLPLRSPIAPGTMPVVSVGGIGIPELSAQGSRNWAFDVTRRAVVFSGLTLRSGEIVELEYATLCP